MHGPDFWQTLGSHPHGTYACDPARQDEVVQERMLECKALVDGEEPCREERVVQLVGVARIGLRFGTNARNRVWIERPHLVRRRGAGRSSPGIDRLRPPLLERRVVEKCVRPRIQDLVRDWRGLGRVAGEEAKPAGVDISKDAREPLEIHRFVQTVVDRLRHERMVGNLPVARNVFEAGGGVRKDRGHQIVGLHPLKLRRNFPSAPEAWHRERDGGVPAPPRLKHWRVEQRLDEHVFRACRIQIMEDVCERKRMLRTERQQKRVFGGRCLQLEVELAAEALAEREAPRLVDAAAERRVQDELHAARLVEESFQNERLLRRDRAERCARVGEIGDGLLRRRRRGAGFILEPGGCSRHG